MIPANDDHLKDEIGRPTDQPQEETAPIPESEPVEEQEIDEIERLKNLTVEIDGEPVIEIE